jgi:hypothetical protein
MLHFRQKSPHEGAKTTINTDISLKGIVYCDRPHRGQKMVF